jgi:hypothetical protein
MSAYRFITASGAQMSAEMMADATGIVVVARTIFAIRSRLSICPPGSQIVEYPRCSASAASCR